MSECQNMGFMKGASFIAIALSLHPLPQVWYFHAEWHTCGLSMQDTPLKVSESFKS